MLCIWLGHSDCFVRLLDGFDPSHVIFLLFVSHRDLKVNNSLENVENVLINSERIGTELIVSKRIESEVIGSEVVDSKIAIVHIIGSEIRESERREFRNVDKD